MPESGAPIEESITVTVIETRLTDRPAAWVGNTRIWDNPDLAPQAVIEADDRLVLTELGDLPAGGRQFELGIDAGEPRYVIARLGEEGPILDNARVDGFRVFSGTETYLQVIETFADGSQLIAMGLTLSPVLSQVTMDLTIFVGGVVFDDGRTHEQLYPDDFDELGRYEVRFIRPASAQSSVCHITRGYQGYIYLGRH